MYGANEVNRMDRLTFDGTRVTVFTFTGDDRTDTRTYWKGTGGNDTVAATGYTFDAFGRGKSWGGAEPGVGDRRW